MTLEGLAFWGLLGAFVYAGPRVVIGLSSGRPAWLFAEAAVALVVGVIGAAGFAPFLAEALHQNGVSELRAIAVVVGMVANPVAPAIIHLMGSNMLRRLGGDGLEARREK